jgi:hypothetical protein
MGKLISISVWKARLRGEHFTEQEAAFWRAYCCWKPRTGRGSLLIFAAVLGAKVVGREGFEPSTFGIRAYPTLLPLSYPPVRKG